jgi:alpha-D-ribose 1-methylphosphonate 5-triphosphate synthase subunit PhnG
VDRTIRCETLAQAASADVGRLAEIMLDGSLGDVQLLTPPTVGMVMARAIDGAQSETFNLGEVLVSEARVSIAGCEGWGMVMGSDASHALAVPSSMRAWRPAMPLRRGFTPSLRD